MLRQTQRDDLAEERVVQRRRNRNRMAVRIFATLIALATCDVFGQQDYPSRPIRIIVPSVAGGGTDSSTRIVVSKVGESLGQRIVVDNPPGAGSIIGTEIVARAAPDGYTHHAVQSRKAPRLRRDKRETLGGSA
jgi:tripartite-type tricarboxylate transporter receptor subunit TctC